MSGASEDSLERLVPASAEAHGLKLFPAGTVLFAKSGMSASKGHVYSLRGPAYVVGHLAALVPHEPSDSRFLVHALQRFPPTTLIRDPAYPSIRLGDIESMMVLAPSESAERQRIAEVLDRAEALRAKRRDALAELDTIARSLFVSFFGDPVGNPKGWSRRRIGDIGQVITGNTPSRANEAYFGREIEWIKSDNINTSNYYLTRAQEGLSEAGRAVARIAPKNSILVTCIAGSPDSIGNAAMTDREVAFNQQINALVPTHGNPDFLYAQILVGKALIQRASTASMKGMVSKTRFEKVELIFPPVDLQNDFACRAEAVEKLKTRYLASAAELDSLFASLQQRAFSGEL